MRRSNNDNRRRRDLSAQVFADGCSTVPLVAITKEMYQRSVGVSEVKVKFSRCLCHSNDRAHGGVSKSSPRGRMSSYFLMDTSVARPLAKMSMRPGAMLRGSDSSKSVEGFQAADHCRPAAETQQGVGG